MTALAHTDLAHIWDKAGDCLSSLQGNRIFLTGGTGFFGIWLLESIAYANHFLNAQMEVVILSRHPAIFFKKTPHLAKLPFFRFIAGDVRYFQFPAEPFSYVIHAATQASDTLNKENPLLMLDTITLGTQRILEFAVLAEAKSFLLTSSGAIYGKQPPTLSHLAESNANAIDPLSATSAYAIGKLMAEHLCLLFSKQHHLPVKIARCFAFVGPHLPLTTHFAIGNFIANALRGEPIQIAGDGSPFRSYLYAADLIIWLWKILCFGNNCEAYNVGSDEAVSIDALANLIAKTSTPPLPIRIAKLRDPQQLAARYVPDISKAKLELNLFPWINLTEAISRTLSWNQSYAKT